MTNQPRKLQSRVRAVLVTLTQALLIPETQADICTEQPSLKSCWYLWPMWATLLMAKIMCCRSCTRANSAMMQYRKQDYTLNKHKCSWDLWHSLHSLTQTELMCNVTYVTRRHPKTSHTCMMAVHDLQIIIPGNNPAIMVLQICKSLQDMSKRLSTPDTATFLLYH